ncbi:MAG: aldo/keto reductase, partial [Bryobacteraceae bacterium]
ASAASGAEYRRGGMVYRKLGKTGLDVSLLSFGSHTDPKDRLPAGPGKTVLTEGGQARRDRILARAFDFGVNLLDVYASEGQWEPAERMVRGRRDKVLVSLAHEVTPQEVDRAAKLFGHVDLYRFHTPDMSDEVLQNWDTLRKAKEAGKVRAIGIATHIESTMTRALDELDDLDFIFFPYNFIHARADYSKFLPRAVSKGVGLIAMKPLASGSIMRLDPRARAGAAPEFEKLQLWQSRNRPILPAAVAELTKSLDRMPDETLCMAAMRFVYAKPFIATAITGMFDMQLLEDNYKALERYTQGMPAETAALNAARELSRAWGAQWLPGNYQWLEEQWRG